MSQPSSLRTDSHLATMLRRDHKYGYIIPCQNLKPRNKSLTNSQLPTLTNNPQQRKKESHEVCTTTYQELGNDMQHNSCSAISLGLLRGGSSSVLFAVMAPRTGGTRASAFTVGNAGVGTTFRRHNIERVVATEEYVAPVCGRWHLD